MEVRILHKFHDTASYNTVYLVGETVTFDDERAEHLIGLGLVEAVEEPVEIEVEPIEKEAAEEAVEPAEEPSDSAETEPIEEAAVKPVAATRRSSNKDN